MPWHAFKQHGPAATILFDLYCEQEYTVENDNEHLIIAPYSFVLLQPKL
jgi:hypothetical protein